MIQVHELDFGYGRNALFRGMDLALTPGNIYGLLGVPERVDMIESDTNHGYPRQHREAVVRFFNRWLRNVNDAVTEPDVSNCVAAGSR